ncbi:MAG: hypothetical protein IT480_18470 [Gammaproteobacteria bacterium]|nr:hypothetical protein [Gammaproteobacteria bacterium]
MTMVWAIKDWRKVFHLEEACRHERVTWTKFPVTTDSVRYKRLMRSQEGRNAYCVFVACVQLSARARANGLLRTGSSPISDRDIADATGLPLKVVSASMELLRSPDIGWLEPFDERATPGRETGNARFANGQETGDERAVNGQRPFLAPARAAKSREDIAAIEQRQAMGSGEEACEYEVPAAAPERVSRELCSLLLGLRHCGVQVFDAAAAAAIAANPNVSRMQIAWATERMNALPAGQTFTSGPAAYMRVMLERKHPPRAWVDAYRRRELAAMAAGGAK